MYNASSKVMTVSLMTPMKGDKSVAISSAVKSLIVDVFDVCSSSSYNAARVVTSPV